MLQIATGMYFRPDVPMYETTHRDVFFTNIGAITGRSTSSSSPVELPVGQFSFSTSLGAVGSVMVEVVDRLEQLNEDGSESFHAATGGTEHLDDAADVLAFALNVTVSRDAGLVRRLVPDKVSNGRTRGAAGILRRTFDPGVMLVEQEIAAAAAFMEQLLSLDRRYYEAAIRAIRTVVDASLLVADEPGLSYTLYVAALESLAQLVIPADTVHDWERYDGKKRKLFDTAFADADLDQGQADVVRAAVMEADQLSLARRFADFTIAHLEPAFYRAEAADSTRPISAVELPNALRVAYGLRSRNVHLLEELAPELWAVANRSETEWFEGRPVLGLEGMNRLARHVVTRFVERSPSRVDPEFRYRDHLPGILRGIMLAPQYWISGVDAFSASSAPRVLNGLCETLMPPTPSPPDMSAVLERIEQLLDETPNVEERVPMTAIYCIWHVTLDPKHHRADADSVIVKYREDLDAPSAGGFAARLFAGYDVEWSDEQLLDLIEQRRRDLTRRRPLDPLPARIDAALLVSAAVRVWDSDRSRALQLVADAVEMLPGDDVMLGVERTCLDGIALTSASVDAVMRIDVIQPETNDRVEAPSIEWALWLMKATMPRIDPLRGRRVRPVRRRGRWGRGSHPVKLNGSVPAWPYGR
jgi:hypothetical protein